MAGLRRSGVSRTSSTVLRAEPFADSSQIVTSTGLSYVVNRPTKYASNPVYAGTDMSYDRHLVYCGGTYVNNRVEMFTGVWDDNWGLANTSIGTTYAYSSDGVSFTKPNLGLVSYGGNSNNNILIGTGALNSSPNNAVGLQNLLYEPTNTDYPWLFPVTHNTTSSAAITRRIYGMAKPGDAPTLVNNMGTWAATVSNTASGSNNVRDIMGLVRRPDNKWLAAYQEYTNTERRSVGFLLSDQTTLNTSTTWTNYGVPTGLLATQPYDQYYYAYPFRYGDTIMLAVLLFSGGSSGSLSDYYYVYDYGTFSGTNDRQWKFELWTSRATDGVSSWTKLDEDWLWAGSGTGDNTPGEWDAGAIKPGAWVKYGTENRFYYCGSSEVHHPLLGRDNFVDQHRVGYATMGYRTLTGMSGTGSVTMSTVSAPTGGSLRVTGTNITNVALLDGSSGALSAYATADTIPSSATDHVVTWNKSSGLPASFRVKVTLTSGEVNFAEVVS